MEWIEQESSNNISRHDLDDLTLEAARSKPESIRLRLFAGRIESTRNNLASAIDHLEFVEKSGRASGADRALLSQCYHRNGQSARALEVVDTGLLDEPDCAALRIEKGRALGGLNMQEEAREQLLLAARLGRAHTAITLILRRFAKRCDGPKLLEQCDILRDEFGNSAIIRCNRALAYSLLDRKVEAGRLIDLDRDIRQFDLATRAPGGNADEFNRLLAEEALRVAAIPTGQTLNIVSIPDLSDFPAMRDLVELARAAFEDYLGNCRTELAEEMSLPIAKARLSSGACVLKEDGSNGQHIHPPAMLSGVYHVRVPAEIADAGADDHRGSLIVGQTDQHAGGYQACWGTRTFKPVPGVFTLFPSHIFHNVIASRCDEVRISIPIDMLVAE